MTDDWSSALSIDDEGTSMTMLNRLEVLIDITPYLTKQMATFADFYFQYRKRCLHHFL